MIAKENFWILVWLVVSGCHARSAEESPAVNVTAVMEGEALLPCDLSTTEEDDQPVLIMVYANDSGTPIYTVDLRGRRKNQAIHLPLSVLKGRSSFELKSGKTGLHLETVWSSDDGLYRCRVDFKKSPTRNSRIYLTVIVPPDSVRILDRNGEEKSSTIGPYVLGMTLSLKCVATGGRPTPKLTWSAGPKDVRGHITEGKGEIVNTLTVPSLQRHHLHQSFICQASNAELAVPVTAAVTIDMTLPPMSIKLMGIDGPLSAGVHVTVICQVVGARPSPTVSWWLDGRPLPSTGERLRDEGNVTENTVVVTPKAEDQGRYLSCRAETPGLLQSSLEDGIKLVVHYRPNVRISLDQRLSIHDIKEGADVPFTCTIKALPTPFSVSWYHNEIHLNPNNTTGGIIVSNYTLVLQNVNRYSSGAYTCRATNSEGQGVSRPIILDVKFSPQCKSGQKWVYGIATHEMVHVSCQVEAHPSKVDFQWVFNNSADITEIAESHITNNSTMSVLTYTPMTQMDYGFLLCWAKNKVGKQHDPCVFKIFPAGPPDKVENCSVLNETKVSVDVKCKEGFDGGLPQSFIFEAYDTQGRKLSNVTSKRPLFSVKGLPSGLSLTIRIYATNTKGSSEPVTLAAATQHDVPKKGEISGVIAASELPSTMELYPSLAVIFGVIGGIIVVFAVIVIVMVVRRPRRDNLQVRLHPDDSSQHILKKDDSNSGRLDMDEKDPDVIPETRGSRADLMECRVVADVSTLYGEMVASNQDISAQAQPSCPEPTPPPPTTHANIYVETSRPTHAHDKTIDTHVESQPHVHHPQYAQQEHPSHIPSPPAVDLHHAGSYHHMAQIPASCPLPTYTLAQAMPVSYTQTLPHPRSNHGRGYSAHPTLQRRSSLYMDPMVSSIAPPIAPPPAYGTPTTPLGADMVGVVPIVSETVCITPNNPLHAHINPPEQYPPKPFPSSFSSDRMESAV